MLIIAIIYTCGTDFIKSAYCHYVIPLMCVSVCLILIIYLFFCYAWDYVHMYVGKFVYYNNHSISIIQYYVY